MFRIIIGLLLMAGGVYFGAMLWSVHWLLGTAVGSILVSVGFKLVFG